MRSRFADHRALGIRDTWISMFPTGSQTCPLVWHSLPCKYDSLAQLLVLFSYEMLPWEERANKARWAQLSAGAAQQPEGIWH